MGIIKAISGAIGGAFADQWLEVIEPNAMGQSTVFTKGQMVRGDSKRTSNTKGTEDIISDGSIIHVYDNQFMMLVDGGKVVDYTAEPGYYKVDGNAIPSLFNGQLGASIKETFARIKYGGTPSQKQQVFYINLQEIKGIKFGTRTPINYFDNFYNAELFLRAHGSYSIKIVDPLKFYSEAVPRDAEKVEIDEINEQYLNEFLEALQSAINQMSADGERISHVASKGRELSKYMSQTLDEEWNQLRGMEVQSVGIASISYDEESQKLINMRNQGAMLSDPNVREGYVQGAMARGVEAAGSNEAGSMAGFMGVGMGQNMGSGMAGAFSQSNQAQMQQAAQNDVQAQQQPVQSQAAVPQQSAVAGWTCSCGNVNDAAAKFCPECGKPKAAAAICAKCGYKPEGETPKFCPECGNKFE
ncbi:SPFH domain-containing protein [Christensenellaceae bacterium OttesenSCG-928-K19]|nr:SPFH domain-containing protein [Christensenellaceae bacterium OttesenSCG-928-K19]